MKYAHEIRKPEVPACMKSLLLLRFDGHKLEIRRTTSILKAYPAVSGKPNKSKFDYSIKLLSMGATFRAALAALI